MEKRSREIHRSDEAEGRYSNYFKVGFNQLEFVLDFGQAYDGSARQLHQTRIITTPEYAKAFANLLLDSLGHYEKTHNKTIPEIARRDLGRVKDGDT